MLKQVKRYIIICDSCDAYFDEENEYPNETNFETIKSANKYIDDLGIVDDGRWYTLEWKHKGKRHYCESCFKKLRSEEK